MRGHTDKNQENQVRAVANQPSRRKKGSEATFDVVDNRPEAIQLARLQEMADNSPQAANAARSQAMADSSPYSSVQRMLDTYRHNKTDVQTKPITPVIQRSVDENIATFKQEHSDWKSVVANIDPTAGKEAQLDTLIANFRANGMGFKYTGGVRGEFEIAGDCGSLARTFIAIATSVLEIPAGDIKTKFYNAGNGWYVPPGSREIDSARPPNVDDGGYYFRKSHVWVEWSGTVYDVLFGVKGQHGREPDDGNFEMKRSQGLAESLRTILGKASKPVKGPWHFKVGSQWYKAGPEENKYVKTASAPVRD